MLVFSKILNLVALKLRPLTLLLLKTSNTKNSQGKELYNVNVRLERNLCVSVGLEKIAVENMFPPFLICFLFLIARSSRKPVNHCDIMK